MTYSASAGFEQNGSTRKRGCGVGSMGRWSAWEIGAMVAGFVVFWPLGPDRHLPEVEERRDVEGLGGHRSAVGGLQGA